MLQVTASAVIDSDNALIKSRGASRSAPNVRLYDREFSINCSPSFFVENIFRLLCVEYLATADKVCIIITCKRQSRATNTKPERTNANQRNHPKGN